MTDTVTLADILARMKQDLAAHRGVHLSDQEGEALYVKVMAILHERDALRYQLEHPSPLDVQVKTEGAGGWGGSSEAAPVSPATEPGPTQHLTPQFHHEADRHRQ